MNFGVTSVAAPKTALSSTAMYSSIARLDMSGARPCDPSTPRCRLASALIKLASTAKASPPTRPDTALQHRLEDAPQEIALAEAAMPVLREGRMVRHSAIKT